MMKFTIEIINGYMYFVFKDEDAADLANEIYNVPLACIGGYYNALCIC